MLKVELLKPDQVNGKATLELTAGTKYIYVPWTLPDMKISAQGDINSWAIIRAGTDGAFGFPTDLGGFDLPNQLELTWIGAGGSDVAGGVWSSRYGAVVITSSYPIRREGIGQVLTGAGIHPLGIAAVRDAIPGAMAQRYLNDNQGALLVAASPALGDARSYNVSSPTLALAAGSNSWINVSGLYINPGLFDPNKIWAQLESCTVSCREVTGSPVDLLLTYWAGGFVIRDTSSKLRPFGDYRQTPGNVEGVARATVPAWAATDQVISRAVVTAPGARVDLAQLGGIRPMFRGNDANNIGFKLYARSVLGGTLNCFTDWAWTDGPTMYVP